MKKGQARTNYHRYSEEETSFLAECLKTMNFPQAAAAFNARFGTTIETHTIEVYCRKQGLNSGKSCGRTFSFTDEQLEFMRNTAKQCRSNGEFYKVFCERFGNCRTERAVVDAMHRYADIRYGNQPEYTPEQDAWLLENGGKMDITHLVEAYNTAFGTSKTDNALRGRMKHLGVDRSHAPIIGKTRFTGEMVEFLDSLPRDMNYAEMARQLNVEFGTKTHRCAVQDICCKRLGFKRTGNSGKFTKGQAGITNLNVGTERDLDGYVFIKIADNKIEGTHTYQKRKVNWVAKHRYIYEQHHGLIPKGWIVIFLDNDNHNFDPDNLYAVPRSIHARMCNNQWYTDSREHTLAAIKLCELDTLLRKGAIE